MMACTMVKISHPLFPWGLLDSIIKSVRYRCSHAGLAYLTVFGEPRALWAFIHTSPDGRAISLEISHIISQEYSVSDESSMDDGDDSSSVII